MNKFYGSSVIFADDFLYQIYEKDGREYSKMLQDISAYNSYYVKPDWKTINLIIEVIINLIVSANKSYFGFVNSNSETVKYFV